MPFVKDATATPTRGSPVPGPGGRTPPRVAEGTSAAGSIQHELSRRVYHAAGVERKYRAWDRLPISEAMALLKHQPAFANRSVLDLGVGCGRTTRYLEPLAAEYECLDFSPVMVEALRRELPWVSVRVGDIRDLSEFRDGAFDFVFASDNVISAVGHEDRLRVLTEVNRVLRTDGKFAFSSHNRRWAHAGAAPRLGLDGDLCTMFRRIARYVLRQINHARVRQHRVANEAYALLDDAGHHHSLLHYYIDRPRAEGQLRNAGFEVLDVFHPTGRSLSVDEPDGDAPSLLYVAAKRAAQRRE